LRVQAIFWAHEPESSIAGIDNRALREGDSVQGYWLVSIEQGSVILQYSGKEYRLEFKYR
jgi:type II secretory pathway component PulC